MEANSFPVEISGGVHMGADKVEDFKKDGHVFSDKLFFFFKGKFVFPLRIISTNNIHNN